MKQNLLGFLAIAITVGLPAAHGFTPPKPGLNAGGHDDKPAVHADSPQISKIFDSSKKLRQVYFEAEKGTKYRIAFVTIPVGRSLSQGFTSFNEGSDQNSITVHVMLDPLDELVEDRLAHELFHIILHKEGFPVEFRILANPTVIGDYPWRMLTDAVHTLESCYADARIDELMTQRHFSPKLLNRRQADHTVGQGRAASLQPPQFFSDWRKNIALANYCLSIRERDFDMQDLQRVATCKPNG
jgi:hypothetical protein